MINTKLPKKLFKNYTPFQIRVFDAVYNIPIGQTRSYEWVAKQVSSPGAQRAVGQALKRNPFPFVIPCHRVIRADGSIGGYVFGQKMKRELLVLEKSLFEKI